MLCASLYRKMKKYAEQNHGVHRKTPKEKKEVTVVQIRTLVISGEEMGEVWGF